MILASVVVTCHPSVLKTGDRQSFLQDCVLDRGYLMLSAYFRAMGGDSRVCFGFVQPVLGSERSEKTSESSHETVTVSVVSPDGLLT
jgi:hypothetical protein